MRPSGLKATLSTDRCGRERRARAVGASRRSTAGPCCRRWRTRAYRPSGLKATRADRCPVCPRSARPSCLVRAARPTGGPSCPSPAEASVRPSGLKATLSNAGPCAGAERPPELPVGRDAPQPDRLSSAGGGQRTAVGAEGDALDSSRAPGCSGCAELRVGRDVPEPDRLVAAGGGERAPVGAERDARPTCPRVPVSGCPSCRWVATSHSRTVSS